MALSSLTNIHAGFLPLTDAAILIACKELAYDKKNGFTLNLVKESSWANIRDRMAIGHFQIAHMLAPMPVAASLGLSPLPQSIIAPMALGVGGNAITISRALAEKIHIHLSAPTINAKETGLALYKVVAENRKRNGTPLSFGVVHPYSSHNFDLRYWLNASGINPETDIQIVVVPPTLLPAALEAGHIDGYCVGEPWNSVAVEGEIGEILTVKNEIWKHSPEKVLGVSQSFASEEPALLSAALRSFYEAARWCQNPENIEELAIILAQEKYIGQAASVIFPALSGQLKIKSDQTMQSAGFLDAFTNHATYPWQSHALWFYTQIERWRGQTWDPVKAKAAQQTFRPDLYKDALQELDISFPESSIKIEGDNQFFDQRVFDPGKADQYLEQDLAN
ncbi:MAG: ABC transporter substrate-binding protein [Sneathiellales bacterium]|nr:ABC transporter substrate-binding protein [Sneathiellales bacterium]